MRSHMRYFSYQSYHQCVIWQWMTNVWYENESSVPMCDMRISHVWCENESPMCGMRTHHQCVIWQRFTNVWYENESYVCDRWKEEIVRNELAFGCILWDIMEICTRNPMISTRKTIRSGNPNILKSDLLREWMRMSYQHQCDIWEWVTNLWHENKSSGIVFS